MEIPPDDEGGGPEESRPLHDLRLIADGRCRDCRRHYTAHEAVGSIALGFKSAPRCLPCLAARLDRNPAELWAELTAHVRRRECFRRAWEEADRMEGTTMTEPPPRPPADAPPPAGGDPADEWDAGAMACGDLVLALRLRLAGLAPGTVLSVRATDPAAPEDLPAWCRMTGHALLSADHPRYLIRRKGG